MNKADWMTALGSIIGVTGIGLGLWWLDAVAALFISFTILSDGVKNMARGDQGPDGCPGDYVRQRAAGPGHRSGRGIPRGLDWVAEAGARARDQGHVLHVECFVVPVDGREPSLNVLSGTQRLYRISTGGCKTS